MSVLVQSSATSRLHKELRSGRKGTLSLSAAGSFRTAARMRSTNSSYVSLSAAEGANVPTARESPTRSCT